MRDYLARQARWLAVERLPAYAPELNPVEGMLWANLKGNELANRCDVEIGDTIAAAHLGVQRIRRGQQLLFGFLGQTGLPL